MYRLVIDERFGQFSWIVPSLPQREKRVEKTLGITEARKRLAQMIDDVKFKGRRYIIMRHGRPAAAVVPIDVYERWARERQELFNLVRELQQVNDEAEAADIRDRVREARQAIRSTES
jgi:prevent-host-death family protein